MYNKRGEGTAFSWILALLTLFAIGLLYIIFNQAIQSQIQPTMDTIKNGITINGIPLNATQLAEINTEEIKYMRYWAILPLAVFIIVIIWLILNVVKKSRDDMYA